MGNDPASSSDSDDVSDSDDDAAWVSRDCCMGAGVDGASCVACIFEGGTPTDHCNVDGSSVETRGNGTRAPAWHSA